MGAHEASVATPSPTSRKSGGPVCEAKNCRNPATLVHRAHGTDTEGYFCAEHWEWPLEVDGVFHQLLSLAGTSRKTTWNRSGSQTEQHRARMRESVSSGWREVMFDWSIGAEVDTATLGTAAENGWTDLQELYKTTTVLEGDVFWQARIQANYLRRAMTRVCGNQGAAKRWQLALTPKPLTFCTGTPLGGLPKPQRPLKPWKLGCGRVFADTERASGGGRSYWLAWCDEHEPNRIASTRR